MTCIPHSICRAFTDCMPSPFLVYMQAQCILYRRYPGVLAPFKYAGYPLLLAAVTLPPEEDASAAHFLAPERTPQLQARPLASCGAARWARIT